MSTPASAAVSNQRQPDALKLKIRCHESGVGVRVPPAYLNNSEILKDVWLTL